MSSARGRAIRVKTHGSHKSTTANALPAVFADLYGARWTVLQHCLSQPTEHVALQNAFVSDEQFRDIQWQPSASIGVVKSYSLAEAPESYVQPTPDQHTRLLSWYWLDRASLLPPLLLHPKPGDTVLDMCAAPGGKSLMLAYMLFGAQPAEGNPDGPQLLPHSSSDDASCSLRDDQRDSDHAQDTQSATPATVPASQCSSDKQTSVAADQDIDDASSPHSDQHSETQPPMLAHNGQHGQRVAASNPISNAEADVGAQHAQHDADLPATQTADQSAFVAAQHAQHGTEPATNANQPAASTAEAAQHDIGPDPNSIQQVPLTAQHGQRAAASGSLTCNEMDPARRARLQSVMGSYLPPALRKNMVRLTPHDAARYWGRFEAETYDCILLDAPCTSERHVMQQAAASGRAVKMRWSVHQCEDMASLQVRLLVAALKALKRGGRVVYSTCSIHPSENDQVITKALTCVQDQMQVSTSNKPHRLLQQSSEVIISADTCATSLKALLHQLGAEATEYGILILPDRAGAGPMYVCLLLKL